MDGWKYIRGGTQRGDKSVVLWGGWRRKSAARTHHNISPRRACRLPGSALPPRALSALLSPGLADRPIAQNFCSDVGIFTQHRPGQGGVFTAKPFWVSKHLFISLKSVPSTRPVKTTPTQPHNWSESVKEPIKRSAAARNMQHIHTVWSPMGHRGARKITELGPYHLSLCFSLSRSLARSLSLAVSGLLSLHTSSAWNVCARHRERRNKVCVCVWGCMSGASKGRGIIRRYRNISTRRPRCRTEANKKERILTGMPIL